MPIFFYVRSFVVVCVWISFWVFNFHFSFGIPRNVSSIWQRIIVPSLKFLDVNLLLVGLSNSFSTIIFPRYSLNYSLNVQTELFMLLSSCTLYICGRNGMHLGNSIVMRLGTWVGVEGISAFQGNPSNSEYSPFSGHIYVPEVYLLSMVKTLSTVSLQQSSLFISIMNSNIQ